MEQSDTQKLLSSLRLSAVFIVLLWVVHALFTVVHFDVGLLGIVPRKVEGLHGILTAPWVHGDWGHLISNSGPMFFFLAGMFYFYRQVAGRAIFWIYLMTGVWVWVAAHAGAHIGASGLVYGLAGFLFFSGVFRRDVRSIALALVIAFFYGGMVWGIWPGQPGISWESHLFGGIAGTVTAWYFRKVGVVPKKKYFWEDEPEYEPADDYAIWNYRSEHWPGARNNETPPSGGQRGFFRQ